MKITAIFLLSVSLVLTGAAVVSAQLTEAATNPIVYGHYHLNVTSAAEHKKFWAGTLGGTPTPFANSELFKFPNVLVLMAERMPTGGTKGTTVNHIGFGVPSVRAMLETVRAAGYPIVTREELPPAVEVVDDMAYIADQDTYVAFVMGPDDVKVELVENRSQTIPITFHHVHFLTPQVDESKAWYVKTFNAVPGMRGSFQAADVPGANLTFSSSNTPLEGTRGRSLDHIGFEVQNLEAFLQAARGAGYYVRLTLHDDRAAWGRHRVRHRSVRHLRRADRGSGQLLRAVGRPMPHLRVR